MPCTCPRLHGKVRDLATYCPSIPEPGPARQAWAQRVVQACCQQCPAALPALAQLAVAPEQDQVRLELQQALTAAAPVVVPADPTAPVDLWQQARQHKPLSMQTTEGVEVAQGIFYCDACYAFLTEGDAWYGCPHDTRCQQCYSSSTTRGAAEGSSAGSGGASGTESTSSS